MTALDYLARHRAGGAPAFILAKIEVINDLRDEALATVNARQDAVNRARRERDNLEADRRRLEESIQGLRFHSAISTDTKHRIAQADEALEIASTKFEAAWAKLEAAQAVWEPRGQISTALDYFLRHHPDLSSLTEAAHPTPAKLTGSQGWAGALARVRDDLAKIDADAHSVRTAPMPSEEAKGAARQHVAELAERARPDVRGLVEFGRGIEWPRQTLQNAGGAGIANVHIPDARGLMAWLHMDEMIAALEVEIDAVADDGQAIPAAEREARLEQIAKDKLHAERREEAVIEAAADAGTALERRPDADPRAVLGIADNPPKGEPL